VQVIEKNLFKNKEVLMKGRKIKLVSVLFLTLFILPYFIWAQTSPEAFLKFKVGADRKLADYNQIMSYFQRLDQESGKVKVLNIGVSSENKPMIMAVITSEQNMGKLDVAFKGGQGYPTNHVQPSRHRSRRCPNVNGTCL
jgi:hypothetical protein